MLDCPIPGCQFKALLYEDIVKHLKNHNEDLEEFQCTYPGCLRKKGFFTLSAFRKHFYDFHFVGLHFHLPLWESRLLTYNE